MKQMFKKLRVVEENCSYP